MIFQSFILDNLVYLYMKIMNSVVVVGLYYGFLSTFSIGPSYLFLLRARIMQEGTEKKLSATAGFITGQLIMFISIYYAPLHLALGRPHIITVIALPYLLFHFFGNNKKNFLNYGDKKKDSIRKFSIQRIFFTNLIFQLFNPLVLPSSILVRLISIYMFRCNNKFLFLTSGFQGWLIGHIFFMKWIQFLFVLMQQNNVIKSNEHIGANKYIFSEFRTSMSRLFSVVLFLMCLSYLGRAPFPLPFSSIFTKKGKKEDKNAKKIDEPQEKKKLGSTKSLVSIFFDFKRWRRPLRYIKNARFENGVRNETSQFFFDTCQNDGKEIKSFTYPPNLSTFLKIMEKRIDPLRREKILYDEFTNYWNSKNEEKTNKLSNEILKRAYLIDKEYMPLDIFENRIRLSNEETQTKNLPKLYDPFLTGPCRGRMNNYFLSSIKDKSSKNQKNDIWINKIHGLLLSRIPKTSYFEQNIDIFYQKLFLTEICSFFNLMQKFSEKSVSALNLEGLVLFPEHTHITTEKKIIKFLFDAIQPDLNDKTILKKRSFGIKEIEKQVPRWPYKLINEMQELEAGKKDERKYAIRCRKAKRVVIFTHTKESKDSNAYKDTRETNNTENKEKTGELALIRYAHQPNFRRSIIKGCIRAQRRKTLTLKIFQKSLYSPLFLKKMEKPAFFFLKNYEPMRQVLFLFQNRLRTKTGLENPYYTEEKTKESTEEDERTKEEQEVKRRIELAEAWDTFVVGQVIRGSLLITQLILRKYIILPSLIIIKNIVRMLLFQFPEWAEDFRDWNRELYIKCTYNGVELSEKEFPQKWLLDGIQIKIRSPFRLKPWHRSKVRSTKKDPLKKKGDFSFLTILGTEVELPFSRFHRNPFSLFDPIFKKLKKLKKKWQNHFFQVLEILNARTRLFLNFLKERGKWIIKIFQFINEKIKQFPTLVLFPLIKKIVGFELSQNKNDSTMSNKNPTIHESSTRINSIERTNSSVKKKIYMNAKRKTIIKKMKKMAKEQKRGNLTAERNIIAKKASFYAKRLALKKNIWQILQKRNPLSAAYKSQNPLSAYKSQNPLLDDNSKQSFLNTLIERVYLTIFMWIIICICSVDVQRFLESKKKTIFNNEENVERTDKTNQSLINFLSLLKRSYDLKNTNSHKFCDVSSLSQAYVFFKLSETQLINIYKLRSVFAYHRKLPFLKNEIKDYFFGIQRIFDLKFISKNPPNSLMNQWTNWLLKSHYQYDLSQRRWSRLVPQKWRNRIHKRRVIQNKDLKKCDSYEKTRLIPYKNQQLGSLKKNTQYEYDLFSYQSIKDKKDSYISRYGSSFQANKKELISYHYKTYKQKRFDPMSDISISIKNYIAKDYIIDMEENLHRKDFDWILINKEILNRSIPNGDSIFAYTNNPWIIPIAFLFFNLHIKKDVSQNTKITGREKEIVFRSSKKKLEFELATRNQTKAEQTSRVDLQSSLSTQEKDIAEESTASGLAKKEEKKKEKNRMEVEINRLVPKFYVFQLNWQGSLNHRVMNNIKIYCLLVRMPSINEIAISSIQRGELSLNLMAKEKSLSLIKLTEKNELMEESMFIIEPIRLSREKDEQFYIYQTIVLSLLHKSKRQIKKRYPEKTNVDKTNFKKLIPRTRDHKITENKEKNHYDLLVPEFFFCARRRREFRILICFNSTNRNSAHRKTTFYNTNNKINNCCNVLAENKGLDRKKNLMNFHFFLWPNFRLEDLACMNRYWFDTDNGSRFSIVRIHLYPRLRSR
uniref:Protein TIC 214 n=1 Tax=Stylosanthes scabra TaxID=79078 RepID=A0A345WF41_9FABA|nr:hypothetical chloroplast RF19 [Stylosanthes scabra]AXJ91684.1 hypothetical chloroplast RF19 [Stylosanthes scabra]